MEHAELSAADSLTEAVCGVIIHKYTDRGWVADPRRHNALPYHQPSKRYVFSLLVCSHPDRDTHDPP